MVPSGGRKCYHGGAVGYTSDDDLIYDGISIYVNGSLNSPTEDPEFFGGLIGYNTANG